MAPRVKKWIINPIFGTAGEGERDKRGARPSVRASGGDGGVDAISKHDRVAEFSKESEEDAVEDFNAPMYG